MLSIVPAQHLGYTAKNFLDYGNRPTSGIRCSVL